MSPRRPQDDEDQLTAEETEAIAALLSDSVPERTQILGPAFTGSSAGAAGDPIVLRYDLVAGAGKKPDHLPGLQLIHERFANEVAAEFRRTVGTEGVFAPDRARFVKFAEIYARMPTPTAIAIVSFAGIGGQMIIAMEPEVMLHFLDLIMGGEGGHVILRGDLATRGFTPAERGIITHVTGVFSRALAVAWSDVANVHLDLMRVATDPRHASIFEPSEGIVDLGTRVSWGAVEGTIHMYFPQAFLGPFEETLSHTAGGARAKSAEPVSLEAMRQNLDPVVVNLAAILGSCELKLSRLMSLEVGDVLRLDADPDEPITLRVEDIPKLAGFPTVQHGNVAVNIAGWLGDEGTPMRRQESPDG